MEHVRKYPKRTFADRSEESNVENFSVKRFKEELQNENIIDSFETYWRYRYKKILENRDQKTRNKRNQEKIKGNTDLRKPSDNSSKGDIDSYEMDEIQVGYPKTNHNKDIPNTDNQHFGSAISQSTNKTKFSANPLYIYARKTIAELWADEKHMCNKWFMQTINNTEEIKKKLESFYKSLDLPGNSNVMQASRLHYNFEDVLSEFRANRIREFARQGREDIRLLEKRFEIDVKQVLPCLVWMNNSCAVDAALTSIPFICLVLISCLQSTTELENSHFAEIIGVLRYVTIQMNSGTQMYFSNIAREVLMDCFVDFLEVEEFERCSWYNRTLENQYKGIYDVLYGTLLYCMKGNKINKLVTLKAFSLSCVEVENLCKGGSISMQMEKYFEENTSLEKERSMKNIRRKVMIALIQLPKMPKELEEKFRCKPLNQKTCATKIVSKIGYPPNNNNHFTSLNCKENSDRTAYYFHDGLENGGICQNVSADFSTKEPKRKNKILIKASQSLLVCVTML